MLLNRKIKNYCTAGIPKPFCKWCAFPKTGELPQGRLRPFSKDHRWLQNQQQNYGKRCHKSISNVKITWNVNANLSNHFAEMYPSNRRSCELYACMNRNARGKCRPVANVSEWQNMLKNIQYERRFSRNYKKTYLEVEEETMLATVDIHANTV